MAWMWYRTLKCDVCDTEIPDTQIYDISIGIPLTQATLCKKCVDEYKDMLSDFIKRKHPYYTRESIGNADMYKYIPHNNPKPTLKKLQEPKHEGRRPTNIFSKLFYMMFFEKVE
jgi:hypothetical protein